MQLPFLPLIAGGPHITKKTMTDVEDVLSSKKVERQRTRKTTRSAGAVSPRKGVLIKRTKQPRKAVTKVGSSKVDQIPQEEPIQIKVPVLDNREALTLNPEPPSKLAAGSSQIVSRMSRNLNTSKYLKPARQMGISIHSRRRKSQSPKKPK